MVAIREYRVTNNCTVEEYKIAQLYAVAKMSMNETGGGEGVEVLKNEPYDNEMGKGQYTYKIYHLADRVPALIRAVAPKGALELHEEAWNGYPHCKTVLTSPWMGKNFQLVTESMHLPDRGTTENALNADQQILVQRKVDPINVANDAEISSSAYKKEEDPKLFRSEKTGRGPLTSQDWRDTCEPVMTCYKLVTAEFKWFGLQTAVESFIHKTMRAMMAQFHRQLFCETDAWHGMTIEELRQMEDKTAKDLVEKRKQAATTRTNID
ncbi:phosphatidylinositol transfer protein beta isoform [Martensiomyces pterosporus]|nr:phosphatidylinositol transfer protein beta isoform [Martensiomyces pterosporus]